MYGVIAKTGGFGPSTLQRQATSLQNLIGRRYDVTPTKQKPTSGVIGRHRGCLRISDRLAGKIIRLPGFCACNLWRRGVQVEIAMNQLGGRMTPPGEDC